VFSEVWRVLRSDGTLWLNLGDTYATGGGSVGRATGGSDQGERSIRQGMIATQPNRMKIPGLKSKDLVGIPWRVAFALQAEGWYLRSDIIWHKPAPMPESVTDRPTKSHEYVFLLAKSEDYYYDREAIEEDTDPKNGRDTSTARRMPPPGSGPDTGFVHGRRFSKRNKRSVWTLSGQPCKEAHFAVFPIELPELCLLAGCPEGGTVLDPFAGSGTTGLACLKNNRQFVGIELNPEYIQIASGRASRHYPLLLATTNHP